jgi:uncharacterized protein YciI
MRSNLEQLRARTANIALFAIFMRPTDDFQGPETPHGAALLAEHLQYLFDLQDQNLLLAAGPLDPESRSNEGMCIVGADSREQAEAIAAAEPFGKAGWRINTVRSWHLNEGVLVPAARASGPTAAG